MNVLNGLKIDPAAGINKAVYDIGVLVNNSSNRLLAANKIITSLGAPKVLKEREAVITSQALIEQAVMNPTNFIIEDVKKLVDIRMQNLKIDIPWAFIDTVHVSTYKRKTNTKRESPKDNNKKQNAEIIFNQNKDKSNGEIAKIIAKELDISYSNAFYYTSRVFKR